MAWYSLYWRQILWVRFSKWKWLVNIEQRYLQERVWQTLVLRINLVTHLLPSSNVKLMFAAAVIHVQYTPIESSWLLGESSPKMTGNIVVERNCNIIWYRFCCVTGKRCQNKALTSCRGRKSFEPIKEKIKLTSTLTQPITKLVWICVLYTKYGPKIITGSKT